MATGRLMDTRAFLEGIEVPCIAAVVQTAPDAPAMCTVQVVATDSLMDLEDRTVVHVFFKDYFFEEIPDELDSLDGYKLFFTGEVRAIQLSKQVGSRSAMLQCEDISAYWDQVTQYMGNYSKGGDGFWDRTSSFVGANKGMFDNILRSPQTMTSLLVNQKSRTRPEAKGLLGGVLRLLEGMAGIYDGKARFRGQNDFLSASEIRLRMIDQIGVPEKDTTSAKIVQAKAFIEWITNSMGGMGGLISYRDILKILFNYTFYRSSPNPLAYYGGPVARTVESFTDIPDYEHSINTRHFQKLVQLNKSFDQLVKSAQKAIDGPSTAHIKPLGTSGQYRTYLGKDIAGIRSIVLEIAKIAKTVPDGNPVMQLMREIDVQLVQAQSFAEQSHFVTAQHWINQAKTTLRRKFPVPLRREVTKKTEYVRERLYTQIFVPELFCCAPPKCNVLFPEHQIQFAYKKDFRAQITRMRIQTKYWLSGASSTQKFQRGGAATSLLGSYYYSPEVKGVDQRGFLGSNHGFKRVILPHERFSGIIPSMQTLGRVNFYLSRKDAEYKKSAGGINYVQRAANFKFFLDRFASREISITGPFNPYVVCSLPVVVLDRFSHATLGDGSGGDNQQGLVDLSGIHPNARSPHHFIGVLQQMSHSLGLDGPTTSYLIRHVRSHKEKSELLGAGDRLSLRKSDKSQDARNKASTKIRSEYLADLATSVPLLPAQDPQTAMRSIERMKGLLESIRALSEQHGFPQMMNTAVRVTHVLAQITNYLRQNNTAAAQSQYILAQTLVDSFTAMIKEHDDYEPESIDMPIEEVLRPPWYDKMYDNKNIGPDYYQPMFGCGSICDDVQFKNESDGTKMNLQAASIQSAIEQIYTTYGTIRQNNTQAMTFIRAFTERPIATLPQVIGDNGFHRHAFSDATGFSDIVKDPPLGVSNAASTVQQIHPSLDIRAQRREIIRRIAEELRDNVLLG